MELLKVPNIAGHPVAQREVIFEIDKAVGLLSHALGIRPSPAAALSLGIGADGLGLGGEVTLDGAIVAAIMHTSKGKKLMSRSLGLLPPPHRSGLIQLLVFRHRFNSISWFILPAIVSSTDGR